MKLALELQTEIDAERQFSKRFVPVVDRQDGILAPRYVAVISDDDVVVVDFQSHPIDDAQADQVQLAVEAENRKNGENFEQALLGCERSFAANLAYFDEALEYLKDMLPFARSVNFQHLPPFLPLLTGTIRDIHAQQMYLAEALELFFASASFSEPLQQFTLSSLVIYKGFIETLLMQLHQILNFLRCIQDEDLCKLTSVVVEEDVSKIFQHHAGVLAVLRENCRKSHLELSKLFEAAKPKPLVLPCYTARVSIDTSALRRVVSIEIPLYPSRMIEQIRGELAGILPF